MAVAHRMPAFFSRFGVPVVWFPSDYSDQESALCIYDAPGEIVIDGVAQSVAHVIRYPSTAFVGMGDGEEIEIEGVRFTVRGEPRPEAGTDGGTTIAALSRPNDAA